MTEIFVYPGLQWKVSVMSCLNFEFEWPIASSGTDKSYREKCK